MNGELDNTIKTYLQLTSNPKENEIIVMLIRKKYDENEEFAILRKKIAGLNVEEFEEYNNYVELCKSEVNKYIK